MRLLLLLLLAVINSASGEMMLPWTVAVPWKYSMLAELPPLGDSPAPSATPAENKMVSAVLARESAGDAQASFPPETPKLFLRWQGEALAPGDKIRCVWIAEDVGDAAPANYQINETSTKADDVRAFGTFTLSRPNDGWPPGKYRVEIYVGEKLAETLRFTIENAGG
jgi:hypothetical protein